jgi:hypothetical protein
MTGNERHSLHRRVHAGVETGASIVSLRSPRAARIWLSIGSVAAAGLVTVGVVTSLGGRDDSVDTQAATMNQSSEALESSQLSDSDRAATTAAAASSDAAEEAGAMTSDTEAMADDTGTDGDLIASSPLRFIQLGDSTPAHLDVEVENMLGDLVLDGDRASLGAEDFINDENPVPDCFGVPTDPFFGVITATVDGRAIEVYIVEDEDGILNPLWYDVDGCELLDR